jgi:hypothetical protein
MWYVWATKVNWLRHMFDHPIPCDTCGNEGLCWHDHPIPLQSVSATRCCLQLFVTSLDSTTCRYALHAGWCCFVLFGSFGSFSLTWALRHALSLARSRILKGGHVFRLPTSSSVWYRSLDSLVVTDIKTLPESFASCYFKLTLPRVRFVIFQFVLSQIILELHNLLM